MRVTRSIREYIQRRVEKVYPIPDVVIEEQRQKEEMQSKIKDLAERTEALIQENFGEEIENLRKSCESFGYRFEYCRPSFYNNPSYGRSRMNEENIHVKADKASRERLEKIAEKVEDVCITLELGCTKDQLEEILAKIEVEAK